MMRNQSGFVLIVVLVLLAIAVLALAGAVGQSLTQAATARESLRTAQRRWGCLSIERTILPQAAQLLAATESEQRHTTAMAQLRLKLGDVNFKVHLCDEQAKINVNRLAAGSDLADARRRLREILAGTAVASRIRLRPTTSPSQQHVIESYGQVLDNASGADLFADEYGNLSPAARITCWGDGRVNVHRASAATLRHLLELPLGLGRVQELLALRERVPRPSLSRLLDQLDLEEGQRLHAEQLLCDSSGCYSLWITAQTALQPRYRLSVKGAQTSGNHFGRGLVSFEW